MSEDLYHTAFNINLPVGISMFFYILNHSISNFRKTNYDNNDSFMSFFWLTFYISLIWHWFNYKYIFLCFACISYCFSSFMILKKFFIPIFFSQDVKRILLLEIEAHTKFKSSTNILYYNTFSNSRSFKHNLNMKLKNAIIIMLENHLKMILIIFENLFITNILVKLYKT